MVREQHTARKCDKINGFWHLPNAYVICWYGGDYVLQHFAIFLAFSSLQKANMYGNTAVLVGSFLLQMCYGFIMIWRYWKKKEKRSVLVIVILMILASLGMWYFCSVHYSGYDSGGHLIVKWNNKSDWGNDLWILWWILWLFLIWSAASMVV